MLWWQIMVLLGQKLVNSGRWVELCLLVKLPMDLERNSHVKGKFGVAWIIFHRIHDGNP